MSTLKSKAYIILVISFTYRTTFTQLILGPVHTFLELSGFSSYLDCARNTSTVATVNTAILALEPGTTFTVTKATTTPRFEELLHR